MARRGSGLAARFREAAQRVDASRSEEEREASRRLQEAREERVALLQDLEALGAELPLDSVTADDGGVVFERQGRALRFLCDDRPDQAGLTVTYTDQEPDDLQRIFRQAELGDRWVWSRVRRGRETRLPLFDQALELLLVHGLGLADPGAPAGTPAPGETADATDTPDERRRTL